MRRKLLPSVLLAGVIVIASFVYQTHQAARACGTTSLATPSPGGFPEIKAKMHSEGEIWALLFFDKAYANQDAKIVWRLTGEGDKLTVQARRMRGGSLEGPVLAPIWGPEQHTSSSWNRPGAEWGAGFNFPEPGCWIITAARGATTGEIALQVFAPSTSTPTQP